MKVVDDLGNPLKNCEIGLYHDKTLVKKWQATYDNIYVLDDLEDLAQSGKSATYVLKQTKAAAGYRLSGDSFKVTISNKSGETRVEIKKNSSGLSSLAKGTGMEIGTDGKQIATFVNERKSAQLELSLDVVTEFTVGTWKDEALIQEAEKREYEFILTWENAKGEPQAENVVLTSGTSQILKAEMPFGTNYRVELVDDDRTYRAELTDNFEGTIGTAELTATIQVGAVHTYSIEAGEPLSVDLVKVDADTKRPLEGVKFQLKDEKDNVVSNYVSGTQGQIKLSDGLQAPGSYKLVETETLEGYELLRSAVVVDVTVQYAEEEKNGVPVLVQSLTAQVAGETIVEESDGSFWVENTRIGGADHGENEKTRGMGIGAIIGLCVAGVAGASAVAVVLIRRKRKKA